MKMEDRKGYEDMEFNFQRKTSVTESNQINITKYGQNGIKEPQIENTRTYRYCEYGSFLMYRRS